MPTLVGPHLEIPDPASMADDDLYKFTMGQAYWKLYPEVRGKFVFKNRRPEGKFTKDFETIFNKALQTFRKLTLTDKQKAIFAKKCPFLGLEYLDWLQNYRYDPNEVLFEVKDGELNGEINGLLHRTTLWEVKLMSTICKLWYYYVDTDWTEDGQDQRIYEKALALALAECQYSDFGTRRRRHFPSQDRTVRLMKGHKGFIGTSNVHLAIEHDVKAIGTMGHEWIMAHSVLGGMRHANRFALDAWASVYRGSLGIALTDTFGTDAFFEDFDQYLAKLFDGLRWDSGDAFAFTDKAIAHYQKLGIDPLTKTIVFSDSLNVERAIAIKKYTENKIRVGFGIGTHFSNHYDNSPAMNIVIKLSEVNGIPVVKLSDTPSKAIGDKDAIRVAKWVYFGTPLDA